MTTPTEKVATAKVEAIVEEFMWQTKGDMHNIAGQYVPAFTDKVEKRLRTTLTQTIEECEAEKREMVAEMLEIIPEHQGGRLKLWSDIKAIAAKYLTSEVSE